MLSRWSSFALMLSLGCGGGCSGADTPSPTPSPSGHTHSGHETHAVAPVEPAPVLRITGEPSADREVQLRIENHGPAEARVAPQVVIETERGGAFQPLEQTQLELRMSCAVPALECVTLAPGATLLPPPWLGTIGDSQCACTRCAPAPAGRYRFVVRTCGGAHRIESEPFELTSAR